MKPILFNFTDAGLEKFITDLGQPKFRAKQVREWLNRGAPNFSVMKNLPESLREKLDEVATTLPCEIVKKLESSDGQTTKFLLGTRNLGLGADADSPQSPAPSPDLIESVLMRTSYGNSVCVSSQVGCAMGCKFCASTLLGLKRNLTANEMLAQLLVAQWALRQSADSSQQIAVKKSENGNMPQTNSDFANCGLPTANCREATKPNGDPNNNDVSHIVVMGTGEPLQNTENLKGFLERANRDLNISWRRMTVSTCGIVPGIKDLTEWGRPINLAISLHSAVECIRSELMPINKRYNFNEVLDAAFEFSDKTGRQLMIEYILLSGKNNSVTDAENLAALLRGKNCMVNLIPWNAVKERDFVSPSGNAIHRFQDTLIKNGIHTRIRRERGADIGSACGQLRIKNAV
jgi:23S rRNA (adenine2503-C2)-methyltransferase